MKELRIYAEKGWDGLAGLLASEREVFLVYDRVVTCWVNEMPAALQSSIKDSMAIDVSEEAKSITTALTVIDFLLDHNASRDALVLAMGGGVTSDVAGWAASIYKRGVRYATLPTTLLSQVDAGIGGKTGVNYRGYKNIIGTIRQPEFVWCAACTLSTLDEAELRSGAAEMLKTFIIGDAQSYALALGQLQDGGLPDAQMIAAAGRIKAAIVQRDPFEAGERRVLNLGHTVGHALEWYQQTHSGSTLTHGEAVAIGIIAAARISDRMGLSDGSLAERLALDFRSVGLPTELPVSAEALQEGIAQDKKACADGIRLVLPTAIGSVEVRVLPIDALKSI